MLSNGKSSNLNIKNDNVYMNFENLGVIEIDFVEMERQKQRIMEVGNESIKLLSQIVSEVNTLASLVDFSVPGDLSGVTRNFTSMLNGTTDFLQGQINKYKDTNDIVDYELKKIATYLTANKSNTTLMKEYNKTFDSLHLSYTPSEYYDFTNLREMINYFEGPIRNSNGDYKIIIDNDGSPAAGPGMHLGNIKGLTGIDPYEHCYFSETGGKYIDSSVVDEAVTKLLATSRTEVENALNSGNYDMLDLTDSQIDVVVSLMYNTGQPATKFLDGYKTYAANGKDLTSYNSQWVNAYSQEAGCSVVNNTLVRRRNNENVLFKMGYSDWIKWREANNLMNGY